MKTVRNKFVLSLIVIAIIALLIGLFFHSYMNKGSQAIPARGTNIIYSWKAGSLRVKGPVTPDSCALTTKQCKCALSAKKEECLFNFNFQGLNYDVNIAPATLDTSSLSYDISKGCSSDKSKNIPDCTIIFKWDKKTPTLRQTQILLDDGIHGKQTLLNVEIQAQ